MIVLFDLHVSIVAEKTWCAMESLRNIEELTESWRISSGGANLTPDRWRRAMHLSYVVGWLTPEESSPIDYSDEDLEGQSEDVKRVLGHRSYISDSPSAGGLWLRHAKEI